MASHSTLSGLFNDIADAIRNKTGSNELISADAFPSAIDLIPTGGDSRENEIIAKTISGSYINLSLTSVGEYAFASCSKLTFVSFPLCSYVGSYGFANCSSLESINMPILNVIKSCGFQYCTNLKNVSVSEGGPYGVSAFAYCSNLINYYAPNTKTIETCQFYRCTALQVLSFPKLTRIYSSVFGYCTNLFSLYLLTSNVPTLNKSNAFNGTPINSSISGVYGSIIVHESMIDQYRSAMNWSYYSNRFSVWNGID